MSKTVYKIMSAIVLFALIFGSYSNAGASSVSVPQMAVTTYYVSPTGNDANAGTQAQPWKTIKKAADTLPLGETVIVLGGNYPERIVVSRSGLSFIAQGAVNMQGFEVTGNNNSVRGFTIKNPNNNSGLRVSGNFNIFENNEVSNTLQDGVWFFGHDNVFRNNYIHDILDSSAADTNNGDPHVDCFQTWDWNWDTYNVLFEGNICNHTRASGSNQIVMLSGSRAKDLTFRNNRFIMHDAGYSPLALYGGSNFIIENNYFCNTTGKGTPAVYLDGATGVTLIDNTYAGYSALVQGSGGMPQTGTAQGSLPCAVFTPTGSPTPTASVQPSITPTASSVPTLPTSTVSVQASISPTASLMPASPTLTVSTMVASATPTVSSVAASLTPIAASPTPASSTPTASAAPATLTPIPSTIPASPTSTPPPVLPSATPVASLVPASPTPTASSVPASVTPTASSVPASPTASSVPILPTLTASPLPVLPTSTSVAPAQQQSQPVSETVYDDKHSSFVYSSDWRNVTLTQASGGSFMKTGEDGSSVTFTFTGQSFSVVYTSGPAYGQVKVYIDGKLVKTIDEKEKTAGYQKRWDYPGQLTLGKHTLKLVVVGNEGRKGSLDAVIVR